MCKWLTEQQQSENVLAQGRCKNDKQLTAACFDSYAQMDGASSFIQIE